MEQFFQAIEQFAKLTPESKEDLAGKLRGSNFPKGHVLVPLDSNCARIYFVAKGLTRTFYLKDGKDITDWLSPEDTFACSIISFLSGEPDRRGIELLEPSEFYSLSRGDIELLSGKHHDIEHFIRKLVSFGLVQVQRRFDAIHFSPAAERYENFLVESPGLINRVPLGIIASYLGITQETLSRIRGRF